MSDIFKRVHEITGNPNCTAGLEGEISEYMTGLVVSKYDLGSEEWVKGSLKDPEWGGQQLVEASAVLDRGCEMMQEYHRPSLERWATITRELGQASVNPVKFLLRADGLWEGARLIGSICVDRGLSGKSIAKDAVMQEFEVRRQEQGIPPPPPMGILPDQGRGLER